MGLYEVCYLVKEEPYDGYDEWRSYKMTDNEEEATELFEEMREIIHPGDYIDDDKHYIDTIGLFDIEHNEFIRQEW